MFDHYVQKLSGVSATSCSMSVDGQKILVPIWDNSGSFYFSSDGGNTFVLKNTGLPGTNTFGCMSADGQIIYLAQVGNTGWAPGTIKKSVDGGETFVSLTNTGTLAGLGNWNYIDCSADGQIVTCCNHYNNDGVRLSTDGGASWRLIKSTPRFGMSEMTHDGQTIVITNIDGMPVISNDGGSTFTNLVNDGYWDFVSISRTGALKICLLNTMSGVLRQIINGVATDINSATMDESGPLYTMLWARDGSAFYSCTTYGAIKKSLNGVSNFTTYDNVSGFPGVYLWDCNANGTKFVGVDGSTVLVDNGSGSVPTISNVLAPANGTYDLASNLDFVVQTSEPVNVLGGIPAIQLEIGGVTKYATYVSGSGSNLLLFRYGVESGLHDADGISILNSLVLNSATLVSLGAAEMIDVSFTAPDLSGVIVDSDPVSQSVLSIATAQRGVLYTDIVLDIVALTAMPAIANDPDFSNIDALFKVEMDYVLGSQRKTIKFMHIGGLYFDDGRISFSNNAAVGAYKLTEVRLFDHDGGKKVIPREQLPASVLAPRKRTRKGNRVILSIDGVLLDDQSILVS